MDLFKNFTTLDQSKLTHKQYISYKFDKRSKQLVLDKLRMLMNLKIIQGEIYIEVFLKKMELLKEILVQDI